MEDSNTTPDIVPRFEDLGAADIDRLETDVRSALVDIAWAEIEDPRGESTGGEVDEALSLAYPKLFMVIDQVPERFEAFIEKNRRVRAVKEFMDAYPNRRTVYLTRRMILARFQAALDFRRAELETNSGKVPPALVDEPLSA